MKLEFVKWKKYNQLIQQQSGWIEKDEISFTNVYQEILSTGFLVNENDTWLTLAASLHNTKYLNPLQIFKPSIIERVSYDYDNIQEKQVEASKVNSIKLPEVIYDINVQEFIKQYPFMKKSELASFFNTTNYYIELMEQYLINKQIGLPQKQYNKKENKRNTKKVIIPEDIKQKVKNLYLQNMRVDDIAKQIGYSYSQTYSIISDNIKQGLMERRPKLESQYVQQLKQQKEKRLEQETKQESSISEPAKQFFEGLKVTNNNMEKYLYTGPSQENKSENITMTDICNEVIKRNNFDKQKFIDLYATNSWAQLSKIFNMDKKDLKAYAKELFKNGELKPKQDVNSNGITVLKSKASKVQKQTVEDDNYIYSIAYGAGSLKLDPPINKHVILASAKRYTIDQLCSLYNRRRFVVEAVLKHLNYGKQTKTYIAQDDKVVNLFDYYNISEEEFIRICRKSVDRGSVVEYFLNKYNVNLDKNHVSLMRVVCGLEPQRNTKFYNFFMNLDKEKFIKDYNKCNSDKLAKRYKVPVSWVARTVSILQQRRQLGGKKASRLAC